MAPETDFPLIFKQLKSILEPFAKGLTVTADSPAAYSLDGPYSEKWKMPVFFGAAQIKKNYVSYYLMPVYLFPDLLRDVSPELKKHMQGKSCFNFRKLEPDLIRELTGLTRNGFDSFRAEKEKGEI